MQKKTNKTAKAKTNKTMKMKGEYENLNQIKDALMALDPTKVRQFNLAVPMALSYAAKCWRSYKHDQATFEERLTKVSFDPADYEDLPVRMAALYEADMLLQEAVDPMSQSAL